VSHKLEKALQEKEQTTSTTAQEDRKSSGYAAPAGKPTAQLIYAVLTATGVLNI
jgi:DNA recombination-dependent growth factor C